MRYIVLWIILGMHFVLTAQQHPYAYAINYEQGLPSNEVYVVEQDAFGYIWVGCDAGLYRYNGIEFKEIEQPNRKGSISNVQIVNGTTIYCQNFAGQVFKCSSYDDELTVVYDASELTSKFPDFVTFQNNDLALITDSYLVQLSENGSRKTRSLSSMGTLTGRFADICKLDESYIGLADYTGRIALIPKKNGLPEMNFAVPHTEGANYGFYDLGNELFFVAERSTNTGMQYAFYRLSAKSCDKFADHISFDGAQLLSIHSDGSNYLFTTANGVYRHSKKGLKQVGPVLFPGKRISYYTKDKEGNHIFSSLQDGIMVIPDMRIIQLDINVSNRDQNISALSRLNDSIVLIGNYGGEVLEFNVNTAVITNKRLAGKGHRAVRRIELLPDGGLIVARGKFEIHGTRFKDLNEMQNMRDFITEDGTIYAIGADRLSRVDPSGNTHVLRSKGGKSLALFKNELYGLFTDGLFVYRNKKWIEIRLRNSSVFGNSLSATAEQLYIGTTNQGICAFDGNQWRTDLFNDPKGSREVLKMLVTNNYLIAARRNGILIVDLKTNRSREWNKYDGFAVPEVTSMLVLEKELLVGTINGLFRVPLNDFRKNTVKPLTRIVKSTVDGREIREDEAFQLDYSHKSLSFGIDAVCIRSRGDFNFEYRISGLNSSWQRISGKQHTITFNTIPAGEYAFEIRAINEDGTIGSSVFRNFTVNAPFWETWWFLVVAFLVTLGLILLIVKYRIDRIRRKSRLKQEMIAAQLTALKAQMNPHFIFNTLNSLQDLIIQKDFQQTNYYLGKFASLMRAILHTSDKGSIRLSEEVKLLSDYLELEKLRFGSEFHYVIHVDTVLDNEDPELQPLLIQPYIENAIKHGLLHKRGNKSLSVIFKDLDDRFACIIEDNGIGRKRANEINARQQHQSFSSEANHKRIELMRNYHGKVFKVDIIDLFENGEASGTRVEILFSK